MFVIRTHHACVTCVEWGIIGVSVGVERKMMAFVWDSIGLEANISATASNEVRFNGAFLD